MTVQSLKAGQVDRCARAMIDDVYRMSCTEGLAAAMARFSTAIGGSIRSGPESGELSPRAAQRQRRGAVDAPIMIEHELREFTSYLTDYAALAPVADRLTMAAGRDTYGCLPYRPAVEIARRLGSKATEFPGAHNGMFTHPRETAARLVDVLGALRA